MAEAAARKKAEDDAAARRAKVCTRLLLNTLLRLNCIVLIIEKLRMLVQIT